MNENALCGRIGHERAHDGRVQVLAERRGGAAAKNSIQEGVEILLGATRGSHARVRRKERDDVSLPDRQIADLESERARGVRVLAVPAIALQDIVKLGVARGGGRQKNPALGARIEEGGGGSGHGVAADGSGGEGDGLARRYDRLGAAAGAAAEINGLNQGRFTEREGRIERRGIVQPGDRGVEGDGGGVEARCGKQQGGADACGKKPGGWRFFRCGGAGGVGDVHRDSTGKAPPADKPRHDFQKKHFHLRPPFPVTGRPVRPAWFRDVSQG